MYNKLIIMIKIKDLHTVDELHAVEELQRKVWGFEPISIVSAIALRHIVESGGVLLGAFDQDRLIGFVLGSPGRLKGRVRSMQVKYWHASLMVAVLPEYQGQDVALQLKLAQRDRVLAQGLDLMTWSFDPLASRNAAFNFRKLGVISNRYVLNLYGDMRDELNGGLESDRFIVEWWLLSPRVQARVSQSTTSVKVTDCTLINTTAKLDGFLINKNYSLREDDPALLIEIPYHWQEMRAGALALAQRWRQETRELFENYFAKGYVVTEVITLKEDQRVFYRLDQKTKDSILDDRSLGW